MTVRATSQQDLFETRADKGREGGLAVSSTEITEKLLKASLQLDTTAEKSGTPMSIDPAPPSSQPSQFLRSDNLQLGSGELGFGSTPGFQDTRRLLPTSTQLPRHENMSSYRPKTSGDQIPALLRDQVQPRTHSRYHPTPRTSMDSASGDAIKDDEQGYIVNTQRGPQAGPQTRTTPTRDLRWDYQYQEDEVVPRTDSQLALLAEEHSGSLCEEPERGNKTRSSSKRPVPSGPRGDPKPSKKRRKSSI